jgi:hypothetical protein
MNEEEEEEEEVSRRRRMKYFFFAKRRLTRVTVTVRVRQTAAFFCGTEKRSTKNE